MSETRVDLLELTNGLGPFCKGSCGPFSCRMASLSDDQSNCCGAISCKKGPVAESNRHIGKMPLNLKLDDWQCLIRWCY